MNEHDERRNGHDSDEHHVHFHFEGFGEMLRDLIRATLNELKQEIRTMSGALSQKIADLQADVQADTTVTASAVTLINGFAQRLADAIAAAQAAGATDAELQQLTALHADMGTNTQALAAAVAANTPAPGGGTVPEGTPQPDQP